MSKIKYRYNPDTLSYQRIEVSFTKKLLKFLPHLALYLVVGTISIVAYAYFADSPKERMLKRENRQLIFQYELLNNKISDIEDVLKDISYRDDNIYRTIFEAEPIPSTMREAGIGGINRYSELEGYDHSEIVINTSKRLDKLMKQMYVQSKSFDDVIDLAKNKEIWLQSMPAIQPILNKDLTRISSYFGIRYDPVYKGVKKMHEGIDFTAPIGTDIYATGNGTVIEVDNSKRGYGNMIIISHGFGYTTTYAHLSKTMVRPGQKVKRGDIIGKVGNTGKSVGPHLHYEVRKNLKAVNPIQYFFQDLSPEEYDHMIELSSQEGGVAME
ncbi:MAG: peptidase M23 [Bacteroidetes bacterium HGW-Bacteroidetes-21]|nr:MAG: peptidase M23 [Bacteroidetes bacterium HGW-Bacteroidetes-21]